MGYGVFKQILLFFVGYRVSRVEKKTVCFLFGENLRHSVDFLFGRKSHGAYSVAYHAAPTIPETNHEHDVEFTGPQRGHCAIYCLFEAANFMSRFDLFACARDTPCPHQYFLNFPDAR